MMSPRELLARLRGSFTLGARRTRVEAELREELEHHVAMHAAENIRRGMSNEKAWRAARVAAGGVTQAAEAAREQQRMPILETIGEELRRAASPRLLMQHKIFSLVVIVTLGIGISSATSVMAVVDSMRHGALPYRNAERLEHLYLDQPWAPWARTWDVPAVVTTAIRGADSPAEQVTAYLGGSAKLRTGERLSTSWVTHSTANFFNVLGARPLLGRLYDSTEADGEPTIVLSQDLWRSEFTGDSTIIGRPLEVNGVSHVVIGVLASRSAFPANQGLWIDDFDPLAAANARRGVGVIALLRPNLPRDEARAKLVGLGRAAIAENRQRGPVEPLQSAPIRNYLLGRGVSILVYVLSVIAAFLALITAVNFAALMLARGIRRRAELGVRAALGASIGRLVRHLVSECLLLCALGGLLAAVLAPAVFNLLATTFSEIQPSWLVVTLGWRSVAFSIGFAILLGIVFGLGPAFDVARPALTTFLRNAGQTSTDGGGLAKTRSRLVAIQVALASAVLVALGSLFGRWMLTSMPDTGFDSKQVIVGTLIDADLEKQPTAMLRAATIVSEATTVPGVSAAAIADQSFIGPNNVSAVNGGSIVSGDDAGFTWLVGRRVSPDFFAVVRPKLVAGRLPTADEQRRGDPLAVITPRMAQRMFDGNPLGRTLKVSGPNAIDARVVGVIDDFRDRLYAAEPIPTFFVPLQPPIGRVQTMRTWEFWARSNASVATTLRTLQIRAANYQLGSGRLFGLESISGRTLRDVQSFHAVERMLLGIFAVALGLAAIGVYGLVAYTAEARRRELAIREALGASRVRVAERVLRTAIVQSFFGVIGGAMVAIGLIHYLSTEQLKLTISVLPTVAAFAIVLTTVLIASVGPLYGTWRRDLAATLRD